MAEKAKTPSSAEFEGGRIGSSHLNAVVQLQSSAFWLCMLSLMIATFLAALDTSAVSTALPTIINDLQGKEFVWIGSAYTLASTAFIPFSGHLATIFGRRPITIGILAFVLYEAMVPVEPTLPWRVLDNRTTVSGYLGTALQGLVISAALFYLPIYFQACKSASPLRSGIDMLPYSFSIAPFAIVAGATATALNKYRPQNIIAWVFVTIGMGLQSSLSEESAVRNWVGFQIVAGIGFGLLFTATTFPILAPLPVSDNASALSFFIFVRSFFQAWGITIGATVLQNQLLTHLPSSFLEQLNGVEIAYSAIPRIPGLQEPLRTQVRVAFAKALDVLWEVMTATGGVGLLSTLLMNEMPLQNVLDENWGLNAGIEHGLPDSEKESETS